MKKLIKTKKQLCAALFGIAFTVAIATFNISLSVNDTGLSQLRATTLQALSQTYIWGVSGCENHAERNGNIWTATVCNAANIYDQRYDITYLCGTEASWTCTFSSSITSY